MKSAFLRKRNIILAILMVLAAIFIACGLSACSSGNSEDNVIEEGYVHLVTYDAGWMLDEDNKKIYASFDSRQNNEDIEDPQYSYVRVMNESLTLRPGYVPAGGRESDSIAEPTLTGYRLLGWLLVETDEEGNETISAEYWDFNSDVVTEDITLRADWRLNTSVNIVAQVDGQQVTLSNFEVDRGENFIGRIYSAQTDGSYNLRADYIQNTFLYYTSGYDTYTATGFYWLDGEGNRVDLNESNAVYDSEGETMTLYVDVLAGRYAIVSQRTVSSLRFTAGVNWYLVEDIDLGMTSRDDVDDSWSALTQFNGSIIGNGHKMSNIWVTSLVARNTQNNIGRAIFGTMYGSVVDVTFENVEFTLYSTYGSNFVMSNQLSTAFLAVSIEEGGRFGQGASGTGVVLENCTLSIVNAEVEGRTLFTYLVPEAPYYWQGTPDGQHVTGEVTLNENMIDVNL